MKRILNILTLAAVLLVLQATAYSQSQPTFTTLSSAITDQRATRIAVTSATGFTASTGTRDYAVFIDNELMRITNVSGTQITVQRGYTNTNATSHKSGAIAIVGLVASQAAPDTAGGVFIQSPARGSCSPSSYPYLPLIQVNANALGGQATYNCDNGQWNAGTLPSAASAPIITRACTPPGLQALALITSDGNANAPFVVGNNMTPVAGSVYYGTIEVNSTRVLTGLSVLNGTVAGTDAVDVYLFAADGRPIAHSAFAGTTASGTDRFQDIPFTATLLATGPTRYWVAYQTSGTTTRFRNVNLTPGSSTAGLGAFIGMLGSSVTAVFGSIPSALSTAGTAPNTAATALPTTLIANTAPISCLY